MKKVKEWIKDHKNEIIIASVSATAGVIGGVCLYKYSKRDLIMFKKGVVDVYSTLYPAMKGSNGAYLGHNFKEKTTVSDCPKLIDELLREDFVDLGEEITGMAVFRKKK